MLTDSFTPTAITAIARALGTDEGSLRRGGFDGLIEEIKALVQRRSELEEAAFGSIKRLSAAKATPREIAATMTGAPKLDARQIAELGIAFSLDPQSRADAAAWTALTEDAGRFTATMIGNIQGRIQALETFVDSARQPTKATIVASVRGARVQRFRKDMIQVGEYTHPRDGYTFSITPEKLRTLAATFHAMRANGVDVEVVKDHSERADDVVGYLSDVFVEGDKLIGIHEMIGEDSIELAQRVRNVSLMIEPDYKDGKGNSYGEAIVHSAIVQRPVVTGQEPFRIAASAARPQPVEVTDSAYMAERVARCSGE